MDNSLFINIASYRDHEVWRTLESLLTRAHNSCRLHIAICWQDDNDLDTIRQAGWTPILVSTLAGYPVYRLEGSRALIEVIALPYSQAQGVGFARALCDQCYRNEQWYLQIDAHSLFTADWDQRLIHASLALQPQSAKPLISSYPPSYHYSEQGSIIYSEQSNRVTFNRFTPEGLPTLANQVFTASHPIRGSFIAAGFIFTLGAFVREVGNDPAIFFEGEEITLSLRAFTWGYDVFHLAEIVLWHHYTRQGAPRIWDDQNSAALVAGEIEQTWEQKELRSQRRVRALLGLTSDNDPLPHQKMLGRVRSRRQFEYQSGLNFKLASCYAECLPPHSLTHFAPPVDDIAWLNAHHQCYTKHLDLSMLLNAPRSPFLADQLFIHLYTGNGLRLMQRQILPRKLTETRLEVTGWSTPNRPPTLIRIAAWWDRGGWGAVVEWPWSEKSGPYCLL